MHDMNATPTAPSICSTAGSWTERTHRPAPQSGRRVIRWPGSFPNKGARMLKTVMQDVVFGLRMLRKNPGFTIVAVLTLALGIGANTTVFTMVNAVLFKGLPYANSGRIVAITSNNLSKNQPQIGVAFPDFLDMQSQSKSFKGLAASQPTAQSISDADLPAALYQCGRVSSNTFSLLGQKPFMGRDFLPEDDEGVGKQVVILGYDLWKTRYGGDP